ncbi:MAG: NAD-dependent malic enzyme [Elusimicrobia bacterium]|nr:NAD-dependent malic enzyme [Elusimicrobiota bacterium]
MIPYRLTREKTGHVVVETPLAGQMLLDTPLLNKGSGFTEQERQAFGLEGLLPPHISTWEEQLLRTYGNFQQKTTDLERYVFLLALQDRNETLFYGLVQAHIQEMMPIIYTPVVGAACQHFSRMFRRPRGLFLSYPDRDRMDAMLANVANPAIDVIVVTDGQRILGLGDLGMNGMGIPVGKLSLYTLCAGIHPATTLPILLDVGTDNPALLNDPLYLGWRHERVKGADYDAFIERFVRAVMKRWPHVLLQWEDFSKGNASRLLDHYRDTLCTFNDDIQGTGAVTAAGILAAVKAAGRPIADERVVILGAGSAATGIGDQIVLAKEKAGVSAEKARRSLWLIDTQGLVHTGRAEMEDTKKRFAQPREGLAGWTVDRPGEYFLADVVRNVKPTALIGTSAQPGVFTEPIVRNMAQSVDRPIIFPLSNPTSKCEALPADLLRWTDGRALVATGSPFAPVEVNGAKVKIGQCNNAYIFPGMGLGVVASRARRVSDRMFFAAAETLAELSPALGNLAAGLFPDLTSIRSVSHAVALAVARQAQREGLADKISDAELEERVSAKVWVPRYVPYRRGQAADFVKTPAGEPIARS